MEAHEKVMAEALSAIHDEAAKLLTGHELTEEVEEGLSRILSMARFEEDNRTEDEKDETGAD